MGCILRCSELGAASLCSRLSAAVVPAQQVGGSQGLGAETAPTGLGRRDEPWITALARPGSTGSQPAREALALGMHTCSSIPSCSNPSYEPVSRPCNEQRCS